MCPRTTTYWRVKFPFPLAYRDYVHTHTHTPHELNLHSQVIYWRVKFPFPLANRDYVYYSRATEGPTPNSKLVASKCAPNGGVQHFPELKVCVYHNNNQQQKKKSPDAEAGTKVQILTQKLWGGAALL